MMRFLLSGRLCGNSLFPSEHTAPHPDGNLCRHGRIETKIDD
tara:strand:- start:203 stop:328 length:126 start_codon:yes stop_codon:yes gene_type:complete